MFVQFLSNNPAFKINYKMKVALIYGSESGKTKFETEMAYL